LNDFTFGIHALYRRNPALWLKHANYYYYYIIIIY